MSATPQEVYEVELVEIGSLRPHERNYRTHPDDQLEHIQHSIEEHGFYRNVVVARDGTILAGHGVVEAATRLGRETIPVIRLDIAANDPQAIRILTGDNELGALAEVDDRLLSELLRELREASETGLLGTGYDDMMLANLVYVTRPASEIEDFDAAAAWVGLPDYEQSGVPIQLIVSFETEEQRAELVAQIGVDLDHPLDSGLKNMNTRTWSVRWPLRARSDRRSAEG